MDSITVAAYKEMLTVTKFVLDTGSFCLKIEPRTNEKDWNLVVYNNSDLISNTEKRIGITGLLLSTRWVFLFARCLRERNILLCPNMDVSMC
jgi:hypothetical protein